LRNGNLPPSAQEGDATYGMVRFTHLLENSLFCEQMSKKVQQGKTVNVHPPHRYVTAYKYRVKPFFA
jgi:hypothetical protein